MFEQFDFFFFHVVGDAVARVANVVAGVDAHPFASAVSFPNGYVADHAGTVFLRPEFEILTQALGYDFQILSEVVGFVLRGKLAKPPTL